jgi:two-component system phosphate regulon sensor histidine kinase PhoR
VKPAVRLGLVAPGVVALLTLGVWPFAGTGWALAVLALGAAVIIAFHLYHLQLLSDWASGPQDGPVPVGRGSWGQAFAAIYKRDRVRLAYQRDLRHLLVRFQQAAEAIPDGIVVLDRNHRIEWANARALVQLGLDLDHDVGQPIVNLVRQPEFLRYLEYGDYDEPIIVASGRDGRITLALQIVPFSFDKKMLMSRDVTQLEAVARMRRDFIANVSHELKTPLTVISGFVETMQDMDLDAKQRMRFLQLMQEQAKNMQRLVADLLTLSTLESEHNPVAEERFAIVPLLLEVSAEAKALSKGEHDIALDIGDAATIVGGREELASAFGNLVSNAIRYTPSRGRIAIAWRVDPDGTGVFSVTDSGIGIAPEHVPRLTERFYRVDRSRSRATGGTGLGLAIVKHVLLRHQAEMEIESEIGAAARFGSPAGAARRARPESETRCTHSERRPRSPIAQRRAEQTPDLVRADIDRCILDDAILRLRTSSERIDLIVAEPQRGETVRHAGCPHQIDDASGQRFAGVVG